VGVLVDGQWVSETAYADARTGEFRRQQSRFRNWIAVAEPGRYHLYVANACPWCHRTLIYRSLKGLESIVSIGRVEPAMLEDGWTFREPDPVTGARTVYELYQRADPHYTGRATVPVLWDLKTQTIVNNESSDIIRMFDEDSTFRPPALAAEIDAVNERIYDTVNNGVYRAGFATRQSAYESAVQSLFESLDWIESRLTRQRYLVGDVITEADWRLFPTLVRFDAVYYGHFKCNLRHVYEYPALWKYTRELYRVPGIADTVFLEEYKQHYYRSHRNINPTGIVPVGPHVDFSV
jgi:glutathionyl-hydroquinone reductase